MLKFLKALWEILSMGLTKSRNVLRISPTDWQDNYICNKIAPGENVNISIENGTHGEQLVITANRSQGRKVRILNESGVVNPDEYLVLVNASQNHVVVTLPPTRDYLGQLNIVCLDPSYGIELAPNGSTSNIIFDVSNITFNAKGDALILVSDRGMSLPSVDPSEEPPDVFALSAETLSPGTWYVVGRYAASWYA
jgi:hypothetical protein